MTAEDRIIAYLQTNRSKFQYGTLDGAVASVKLGLFYGMSPLPDDEIRKIISRWALVNAVGLLISAPGTGAPANGTAGPSATTSDIPMVDAVKKALKTVTDGVTIGRKDANVNISVTGLTANLEKGDQSAELGISWGGTLKLDAKSGPFHFSGNLAKDKWEITLSFPQDTYIPQLEPLAKVMSEGEKAMGKIVAATRSFNNLSDVTKVTAMMKPHATAVQNAVDAVSGIAKAEKKGGPSFGLKFGSPDAVPGQDKMPGGVQGEIVFTYVF